MVMEGEGNYVNYLYVQLLESGPRNEGEAFDPQPILGVLSINPRELEAVRSRPGFYTFSDHKKRLKITVSCPYDGAVLEVGFSSKYYGD